MTAAKESAVLTSLVVREGRRATTRPCVSVFGKPVGKRHMKMLDQLKENDVDVANVTHSQFHTLFLSLYVN